MASSRLSLQTDKPIFVNVATFSFSYSLPSYPRVLRSLVRSLRRSLLRFPQPSPPRALLCAIFKRPLSPPGTNCPLSFEPRPFKSSTSGGRQSFPLDRRKREYPDRRHPTHFPFPPATIAPPTPHPFTHPPLSSHRSTSLPFYLFCGIFFHIYPSALQGFIESASSSASLSGVHSDVDYFLFSDFIFPLRIFGCTLLYR